MSHWTPYATEYEPLAAGSIDGTDTEPHDRAVDRAMHAHYTPPDVDTKTEHTLFVGRLPHSIGEEKLRAKFSCFGKLKSVRIIRNIVTGQSKGYGFVEFCRSSDAVNALQDSRGLEIEGYRVIVDKAAGQRLKGWVPRRLGGGFGGRKEAGQLRFGCVERPWKRPIIVESKTSSMSSDSKGSYETSREQCSSEQDREKYSGRKDHYSSRERHRDHSRRDHDERRRDRDRYHNRSYGKDSQSRSYYDRKEEK
ncbi:small nuclear ribonucleoprotein 35kDa (U11 U12) [Halocaridina rubra]|uniref:U11/U12 small nuclear ribonucleoprotein 35 kDa protein n=1 Tax=Halocaridina rubra TaxID=373956 RepID=A0AAN8WWT4_HALRR